jgi:hypothetical protein
MQRRQEELGIGATIPSQSQSLLIGHIYDYQGNPRACIAMLLRSGPASMRRSVCRVDPDVLGKNCMENAPESIINEAQGDPKRQPANR